MKRQDVIKTAALLLTPLLLFLILPIPYMWANSEFIVDWLGCGCPKIDEFGNTIQPDFNANDFTACFWLFVSLIVTVLSLFLMKRIPRNLLWLRILYVATMAALSLLFSFHLWQHMMWK